MFDLSGISDPVSFFRFPNTVMNAGLGEYGAWTSMLFMIFVASFVGMKMFTTMRALLSSAFVTMVISFGMASAGLVSPVTPMAFLVLIGLSLFVEQ